MLGALAAFAIAAGLLTITPGLDTAMVLRAAASGPRAGAAAGLGVIAGCFVWGAAAAFGLGALLTASPLAFAALRWAGAAYLVFVGVRLIVRPRAAFEIGAQGGSFRRGFLTNLLNPKVGVFYATFLPQFVPAGAPVVAFCLALTGIHAALGAVWFALLICLTTPLGRWLRRPSVVRNMDRTAGGVFVAFGLRLALRP